MTLTAYEVLEFVKQNDIKFIRLAFCDLLGRHKNISIMPEELEGAFENGISFDAFAIKGFNDITKSDLLLYPDPATLAVLPWRPQQGRVIRFYCNIKNPDGTDFWGDTRNILKNVLKRAEGQGYICQVGAECEFYLFKTDENGEPTTTPFDRGSYFDVAPLDKGENVRREICLCLEEMGLKPESSHHEQGPGQNEIDFKFSDALTCADNFITFKTAVKIISSRNGLFASFLPKPLLNQSGSGLHINLSLAQNGKNVFRNEKEEYSKEAEMFMAGILRRMEEITLFLNPLPNSYDRFGEYEAPKYVSWSHGNRSQLVRIPFAKGEKIRMELRSPDPSVNPYIAFSLVISAGLEGLEKKLTLPESINVDLYTSGKDITDKLKLLPPNMGDAIREAEKSEFVKNTITEKVFSKFIELKKAECQNYENATGKSEYILQHYFRTI